MAIHLVQEILMEPQLADWLPFAHPCDGCQFDHAHCKSAYYSLPHGNSTANLNKHLQCNQVFCITTTQTAPAACIYPHGLSDRMIVWVHVRRHYRWWAFDQLWSQILITNLILQLTFTVIQWHRWGPVSWVCFVYPSQTCLAVWVYLAYGYSSLKISTLDTTFKDKPKSSIIQCLWEGIVIIVYKSYYCSHPDLSGHSWFRSLDP